MKITRFTQDNVNKNLLKGLECGECRKSIDTFDLYTVGFALNKNNGQNILLCGDCARELKVELDINVR